MSSKTIWRNSTECAYKDQLKLRSAIIFIIKIFSPILAHAKKTTSK